MEMTTSLSSRYSCNNSYSTLTSQDPAFSDGQQLTIREGSKERGGEEGERERERREGEGRKGKRERGGEGGRE